MSHPKRYKFFKHIDYKLMEIDAKMVEWSDGNWVDYSDYAALAAENERLRSKLSFSQSISEICNQPHEGETITVKGAISSGKTDLSSLCQCDRLAAENERRTEQLKLSMSMTDSCIENINRLTAENERLRKAGDSVAHLLGCMCEDDYYRLDDYYKEAVDAWLAAKEGRDAK